MIADLKPYPAMKDSGVPWLGDVPEHWEVVPNRALFHEIKDRDCPDEQMLSVTIRKGIIRQAALLEDTSKKDSSNMDRSKYKLVQPSDIAYNKMRAWQGAVGVSDYRGIISPAYVVERPRPGGDSRYFHYLLRTPAFAKEAERWSYGITSDMWSLRPEHFKMIYECLPPLPEQASIVRFLDHWDQRVRRYIRAKQKLIRLLEEQKQAIIHSAVTRGLDPDVPLKPSGVEWLGDIPEHWKLKRFKFVTQITSGQIDPRQPEYRDLVLVAPNHIESGTGCITHEETANEQGADSGKYKVEPRQIIYSKIRPNLRKAAIATKQCLCSADMYPITVKKSELHPMFLLHVLLSEPFTKYTVDCSLRVAMPKINRDALGKALVWYPSLDEQDEITSFLDKALRPYEESVQVAQREIELLREYRTRLIADVVTGKLNVREAAARLPKEPAEPEPLDEVYDLTDNDGEMVDDLDAVPEEAEA